MDHPNLTLRLNHWVAWNPVLCFVLLAYGISWTLWISAALLLPEPYATTAHYAGAFGPLMAAALVVSMRDGSAKAWFVGLFKWRVKLRWYAFVLLFPAFLIAIMSALYLITGNMLEWHLLPERLSAYAPTLAFMAVVGGGNEEPGWRGFALPELMKSYSPFAATLILGLVWAVWHAPILLTNNDLMSGAMSTSAILALIGVTLISITVHAFWYTWLYNKTSSVLLCILLHAGYNTANGLLLLVSDEALTGPSYQTLLTLMTLTLIGSVVVLLIATRGRLGAS